jgi:hypothetical protein
MARDYARSQGATGDAKVEPFYRIGQIGAWSCGTFALGGLVILGFAVAVVPRHSEAAAYALGHVILLMLPGFLWGGLYGIFSATDEQQGLAVFGKWAVATDLMCVGAGFIFTGYWACSRYLAGQDAETRTHLTASLLVLIGCAMPGLCLLVGLSVVAAYRAILATLNAILATLDYVLFTGPEVPEGKGQSVAASPTRRGFYCRRCQRQGMSEDSLA